MVASFALAVAFSTAVFPAFAAPSASGARTEGSPSLINGIWRALGNAAGSTPLTFTFVLEQNNAQGLEDRMLEIAYSNGAQKWLTDDELATYVKPSDASVAAVNAAIQQLDGTNVQRSKSGDKVTVTSTVAKASSFFSASFKTYQFNNSGTAVRTQSYTLPAALNGHVSDVYPLNVFGTVKRFGIASAAPLSDIEERAIHLEARGTRAGCSTASTNISCIRSLYGYNSYQPTTSTGNPRLGIMAYIGQNFAQFDLTTWLRKYRPEAASYQIPVENTQGAINVPLFPGLEAALDTQTASGIIYPLPSKFYNLGTMFTQGDIFLLTFQQFLSAPASDRPSVITISYGSLESEFTAQQANTMCNSAKQLTALGTTIVVSSGDSGVNGQGDSTTGGSTCPPFIPTYPSGCQYILSVGATQDFNPEVMVDTNIAGFYSGAGFSNIFPRPSYQDSAVSAYIAGAGAASRGKYNQSGRAYPDVAAQGSQQPVVQLGVTQSVGGTSASAPIVASGLTLLNDILIKAGKSTAGWINPTLYRNNGGAFTDVTSGGSYDCGTVSPANGLPAASGWDASAGFGTPVLQKLRAIYGV